MSNQQTAQATSTEKPNLKTLQANRLPLVSKISSGSYAPEDLTNLTKIDASIKEIYASRKEDINKIKQLISNLDIPLTEIFTRAQLEKALEDKQATSSTTTSSSDHVYPSDKNQVILLKPATGKAGGREWSLKEGRIYEPLKGKGNKPFGQAIPKALTDAKTEQGILALATPYGKQYFATEKGKKELAEIVKVAQPPVKAK